MDVAGDGSEDEDIDDGAADPHQHVPAS